MSEENTEYSMAEDLLRDLDGLVENLGRLQIMAADNSFSGDVAVNWTDVNALVLRAQRAQKIAQVYYDRVK